MKCDKRLRKICDNLEPVSSWIALASVCLVYALLALPESVFGILYDGLIEKFDTTRTTLAWAASLQWIFLFLSSLFISPLIEMFGCRRVALVCSVVYGTSMSLAAVSPGVATFYITYGILAGSGSGGLYLATTTVIQQLFTDNRGLANGIMPLGFSIGWIIHPLHTSGYFLEVYGLSGTLLLHGALCFHTAVFSMALKSSCVSDNKHKKTHSNRATQPNDEVKHSDVHDSICSSENSVCVESEAQVKIQDFQVGEDQLRQDDEPSQSKEKTLTLEKYFKQLLDFSMLKNVCFILCCISNTILWFTKLGLYTHLVSCAVHRGVGAADAAYLMSIAGFGNIAAKIIASLLMNISWMDYVLLDLGAMTIISTCSFMAAYCWTYGLFAVCAALLGIADAIHASNQPLLVIKIVGSQQFSRGMAMMLTLTIPAPLGAPPFVGWLVDRLGTYRLPFLVLASLSLQAVVLTVILFVLTRTKASKS